MTMATTKKSISERIRITKTGKLIRRRMGVGHFRAKKNKDEMRRHEETSMVSRPDQKVLVKKYGLRS